MRNSQGILAVAFIAVACGGGGDGPLPVEGQFTYDRPETPKPDPVVTEPDPPRRNPYSALTGGITFDSTVDGVGDCNATIALTGTPYAGNCRDCTFAFDVSATLEASGTDCNFIPQWTWLEDDIYFDLKLGYGPDYRGLALDEVLWFGYSVDLTQYGYGTYDGPFWVIVHHEGFTEDAFAFDGETLSWEASAFLEYGYGPSPYIDYSCNNVLSNNAGQIPEAAPIDGSIPCDDRHMDVYTVQAQRGETLRVSVDTANAATAFQPLILVNSPDGCLAGTGISGFACTYPPAFGLWCAGMELDIRQSGTYEILVQPFPETCTAETADYTLRIDGVRGTPVLFADDPFRFDELRTLTFETRLDATLTWAP